MLIYLDMCGIQRPLDDKFQLRVRLEAEAVLAIVAFCESRHADLLSSDVLELENSQNPHPLRKAHASGILDKAINLVRLSPEIERRAQAYVEVGLRPLDSLHLSCAVEAGADFFCTCDDRLLKRARVAQTSMTKVLSPLELITELGI